MDASFKLTRQGIHAAYAAGSEAVVALVEETVAHFTAIIEQQQQRIEQQQRITALEQELQELKKDSHDSGKPPSRDSAGSVRVTVNAVVPGVCAGPRLRRTRSGCTGEGTLVMAAWSCTLPRWRGRAVTWPPW